ncbi:MAG: hypothetical protein [Circular genetic element sp.]|nr:MAG: hypothetical protein [Circular genetic element sp.]
MALVTTTLTPKLFKVPFTGPGELQRRGGAAARAELYFSINSGAWPAATAGNDRKLEIPMALPKDFAYLCTDASLQLRTAANYTYANNQAEMEFVPDPSTNGFAPYYCNLIAEYWSGSSVGGTPGITSGNSLVSAESNNVEGDPADPIKSTKTYGAKNLPGFLLFPYTDTRYQSNVKCSVSDTVDTGYAATAFFLARFVQYDISQAYNWAPNSPIL